VLPCWGMGTLPRAVWDFRAASDSSLATGEVSAHDRSRSIHRLGDCRGDRDYRRVLHGVLRDGSSLPRHTLTLRTVVRSARHATKTSRREFWNGDPERLPDGFTVTKPKGDHVLTAVCEVWTDQMGWEQRLQVDGQELLMSSLTRSGAEMLARVEEWHRAMLEKGCV
jgi:hypothetical protein